MGIFSRLRRKNAQPAARPFCAAVIAAGGISSRMQGIDKIFAEICGVPVIARSMLAFENCPEIDEIVVAVHADNVFEVKRAADRFGIKKLRCVVAGGAERIDSVMAACMEVSREADYIAVHDGARPLVSSEIIHDALMTAVKYGSAVPAVAVNDTIKRAESGVVTETPNRSRLYAVQTPQVFSADILKAALQNAKDKGLAVTDDSMAVEALGARVRLSKGSYSNIKITTPIDLAAAEAIIAAAIKGDGGIS